ncbi:MAG: DEAD/DEAH box helicase [Crocinitomicaceae bacterium TMED209]|nr:MAG: DEAD/DEAH box helicase [Crocinitomicaceae bacterium TMED209]|tara:strand:- start:10437 stop:11888 length:1452 start_codon:yes stop_codon:yes gene_type:complete
MQKAILHIKDEVNVRFEGLDVATRRKVSDKLKYFIPYAYHLPAYKLGRWDGFVRFCDIGGRTYLNLIDKVLPIIEQQGYEIEIKDDRKEYKFNFDKVDDQHLSHINWPKGHPAEGEPIILRDYQVKVINDFIANPQCLQEIATGAGKTIITATLSKMCQQYGRTIVIVPNKSLVTQTEEDYINLGLDVGVYYGERKELNHKHTICTWQSLNVLHKKTKKEETDFPLDEFLDDVVCVMVDEVHMAKADVLKQLLTGPFAGVPIRWGLTGTIPKEEYEKASLVAGLGQVISSLSASELQNRGVLAQCHVNVIQTQELQSFRNYQEELTFLTTNQNRMQFISNLVEEIRSGGNTLILIDRIKTGESLKELIPGSVFIQGKTKMEERQEEYNEVATEQYKVLIATYGVAAVGINLPRIFNLVLVEPGKSFVRVIQSIGRGIRKAKDKDHVQIWDITSSCKFSKRHLTTRKKFYKEANYPYTVNKVNI